MKGGPVLASLVTGGGVAAYYNAPDYGLTRMLQRVMDTQGFDRTSSTHNRELEQLYRMVESLSRDVNRRPGPVTIMHGSSGGNSYVVYYVFGAGAVGALYLKIFKGWRLSDLMYVTRGHLRQGMASVSEGVTSLQSRLQSVRAFLKERIDALAAKQDTMAAAQEDLKEQVGQVGSSVAKVHDSVTDLEEGMAEMRYNQAYANDGLFALCRVVSNLIRSSGAKINGLPELEAFVNCRPAVSQGSGGLASLLEAGEAPAQAPGEDSGANGTHRRALHFAESVTGRSQSSASRARPMTGDRHSSPAASPLHRTMQDWETSSSISRATTA